MRIAVPAAIVSFEGDQQRAALSLQMQVVEYMVKHPKVHTKELAAYTGAHRACISSHRARSQNSMCLQGRCSIDQLYGGAGSHLEQIMTVKLD